MGEGHSSPVVVGERVYVFAREGEQEGRRDRDTSEMGEIHGAEDGPLPACRLARRSRTRCSPQANSVPGDSYGTASTSTV